MTISAINAPIAIVALVLVAGQCSGLTPEEIAALDGSIIVGNRNGGKIQIFDSSQSIWTDPLWEYDTKAEKDGLRVDFDWINDVKRVRHNGTDYILLAGNGPGIALFNLETERFDFSYQLEVPKLRTCEMKKASVHAAEMLPDGNFAVADPTGSDRGGNSLRLIYGDNNAPEILQSIPFSGIHALTWDHKRQRLWAWGGKIRKFKYRSAGKNSMLKQDGDPYFSPRWITGAHDMMPMAMEGQPDKLIFNCAEGVGVFHIESGSFELLYGTLSAATNIIPDEKIHRGKGLDHNSKTGEIIHNRYNTFSVESPGNITDGKMTSRRYVPNSQMSMYKAHWFQLNTFSYGPVEQSTHDQQSISFRLGLNAPTNKAPVFSGDYFRKPDAVAGEKYVKVFRGGAADPDGDSLRYEKVCAPDWAKITRTGKFIGTPRDRDIGKNRVKVRVMDPGGLSDVATFEFEVLDTSVAPSVSPSWEPSLPPPTVNMSYSSTLEQFNFTWSSVASSEVPSTIPSKRAKPSCAPSAVPNSTLIPSFSPSVRRPS